MQSGRGDWRPGTQDVWEEAEGTGLFGLEESSSASRVIAEVEMAMGAVASGYSGESLGWRLGGTVCLCESLSSGVAAWRGCRDLFPWRFSGASWTKTWFRFFFFNL